MFELIQIKIFKNFLKNEVFKLASSYWEDNNMKFKFAVSCYVPVETQFFDYINRVPVSV